MAVDDAEAASGYVPAREKGDSLLTGSVSQASDDQRCARWDFSCRGELILP